MKLYKKIFGCLVFSLFLTPLSLWASTGGGFAPLGGIRIEFILFGLTLLGITLFHRYTLKIALTGLFLVVVSKLLFDGSYPWEEHFFGNHSLIQQILHKDQRSGEWSIVLNIAGLLLGFPILAKYFQKSEVPHSLPRFLPSGWGGPFVLLFMIFALSAFLDNIAAALIGGAIAAVVFNGRIHVGYLVAIVAASNAGGAGSVLGDTTTTMMWIEGVHPTLVLHAYVGALTSFVFFATFASIQQLKYQPVINDQSHAYPVNHSMLFIVIIILILTVTASILFDFPAIGLWIAILCCGIWKKVPWTEARNAVSGTIFLLSLVIIASLMPVEDLPVASWRSALGLGVISAVFDNIPLTKLALQQGGYDWGVLAYAVGCGGSMIWFGSSAGVAISGHFKEAQSIIRWIGKGWHVPVAFFVGFLVLLLIWGWNPQIIQFK